MRKAFILIVSVCVLLFTACGQKPVNSEEVSSPQEPSAKSEGSIFAGGGDDLPAAGTEVTAQAAPEKATEETAATGSGKTASADAASQRASEQAPVAPTPTEDIPSETVHAKTGCRYALTVLLSNMRKSAVCIAQLSPLETRALLSLIVWNKASSCL